MDVRVWWQHGHDFWFGADGAGAVLGQQQGLVPRVPVVHSSGHQGRNIGVTLGQQQGASSPGFGVVSIVLFGGLVVQTRGVSVLGCFWFWLVSN